MKDSIVNAATVVAAACALVVTGLVAYRELGAGGGTSPSRGMASREPIEVPNWREVASVGHQIGAADAPVTIVEFGDFECPVCAAFAKRLHKVRAAYPNDIRFVFRHWPLSYHKMAYPAARASECAAAQGKFQELHDLLYARQDSLGLITFAEFGKRAGVPDMPSYEACIADSKPLPNVQRDIQVVEKLGGTGTPTIIINGLMLQTLPDSARFAEIIEQAKRSSKSRSAGG